MTEEERESIQEQPMLRRLVQPYDFLHLEELRTELIQNPDSRVIHTWRGKHLMDKQKMDLCENLNLPVRIAESYFKDWIDAAVFICKEQLKRDDLTPEYRKYLIGSYYHYSVSKSFDPGKAESKKMVSDEIGKQQSISAGTVLKYNCFSDAVNAIFDTSEEFGMRILTGVTRVSIENTIEISKFSPEEIRSLADTIIKDNVDYISLPYIRNEVKWSHVKKTTELLTRREKQERKMNNARIRQMPEYDPDSEVNSLCMTIDSWVSSIERVKKSENFSKITQKAGLKLMNKLTVLQHTISNVQESLVERNNA